MNHRRKSKRYPLAPGQVPDPLGAHGAWVYLVVSVLAGALTAAGGGSLPALLAGGGMVGVFVLAGSLAVSGRRAVLARLLVGLAAAIGSSLLALGLGAEPSYLVVGLLAVPAALAASWFAAREGFLSPGALAFGVSALAVAGPAAARAGGASLSSVFLLLAILTPFYFWRTWRLAKALGSGWTKRRLQRRGLLESTLAVAWAALAMAASRLLG